MRAKAVALVVIGLIAASCSSGDGEKNVESQPPITAGKVVGSSDVGEAVRVGSATALVATSEPQFGRGVGVRGYLTLTSGGCLGMKRPTSKGPQNGKPVQEIAIVWSPGTKFRTVAGRLEVTAKGMTVHLGERFDAGSNLSINLAPFKPLLPASCRYSKLLQVGLGS